MKKTRFALLAVLTLIAVALIAILAGSDDPGVFLGKKREPTRASSVETSRAKRLSSDAVLSVSPGIAPSAVPGAAKISPLMQEFSAGRANAQLYSRLSKAAARSAEESWVLAKVLEACAIKTETKVEHKGRRWVLGGEEGRRRFLDSLSERDPKRAQRIAAFQQVNDDPCGEVANVEVSERDIRKLLEESARAGDPKGRADLLAKEIWDSARGPDGKFKPGPAAVPVISDPQIETLKQLASSGDPFAMVTALSNLGISSTGMSLRAGPNEIPVDGMAWQAAGKLVACDYGYPCGGDTRQLLASCAFLGQCGASDYREFLFYYQHSPSTSQAIGEYQAALSGAVRSGDWSYFTFHRGPAPNFAPYQAR